MEKERRFSGDKILIAAILFTLAGHYSNLVPGGFSYPAMLLVSVAGILMILKSAAASLREKRVSVDLLALIALGAALLAGEWASAAFINLMLAFARVLSGNLQGRARSAIRALMKLRPEEVRVRRGREIIQVPLDNLKIDDLADVGIGERIPADGTIENGEATVDQSSLTGESYPVHKKRGDKVLASCLLLTGHLEIRVKKAPGNTALDRMIRLVEKAQSGKARIHTAAEKFAAWYILLIFLASVSVYLVSRDIYLVLALLLVACADDIAVAIPAGFLASLGNAARRGVILKGANFLDALAKTQFVVVDKTGTLTQGRLKIQKTVSFSGFTDRELLQLAALSERQSNHPVAKAIWRKAREEGIEVPEADSFSEHPGRGVSAVFRGKKIVSGNAEYLSERGVRVTKVQREQADIFEASGYKVNLVGVQNRLAGALLFSDEIRPNIREAINDMKKMGAKKVIMLSGDNERIVRRIAQEAGVDEFHAGMTAEEKLSFVKRLSRPDSVTVVVGDGVNDAAALASADVGVAMGVIGSDAAIEAADVALMRDDFAEIPKMIDLGRKTLKVARQDFWIWGIINAVGLVLVFGRYIGPEGAAAYNFATDFIPLINSLRLFNFQKDLI